MSMRTILVALTLVLGSWHAASSAPPTAKAALQVIDAAIAKP